MLKVKSCRSKFFLFLGENADILSCIKHGIQKIGKRFLRLTGISNLNVLITLMVVFMLAFCVYGAVIVYIGPSYAFSDGFNFHLSAQNLARYNVFTWSWPDGSIEPSTMVLPGYTIFLSLFYRAVSLSDDRCANFLLVDSAIVGTQLVMVSLAASAIFLAGYFLGGKRVACLAAFFAIAYLAVGANAATMFTESVTYFYISFIMLAMVALLRRRGSPWFWMTVFGLFSGLYLITRAAIVIYIAAFLAFWVIYNYKHWQKAIVQSLVAGMCIMLFMGPWIARNYHLHNEVIIFNTASDNPLFISTFYDGMGGAMATEEEIAKFGETCCPERGLFALGGDIARYRLANAREEWGLGLFIYVRYVSKIANYPNQPTLMLHSSELLQIRPDVMGNRDYDGPYGGEIGGALWRYTIFVHQAVLLLAVIGTFVTVARNNPSRLTFLILALFPIYMFAVHLQILYLPRYMYQSLPATFLLAGGVALLLPRKPLLSYFGKLNDGCSDDASDSKLSLTVSDQR